MPTTLLKLLEPNFPTRIGHYEVRHAMAVIRPAIAKLQVGYEVIYALWNNGISSSQSTSGHTGNLLNLW